MSSREAPALGMRYAQITGWGMAVPEKVLTNDDLARVVDTTDEWIVSHTGIRQRHVAGEKESTSSLAVRAAREALLVADVAPAQIDLVIVATVTPDYPFPATSSLVQDALGAANAGAFDLGAGCSGFIYALSMAADVIRAGSAQHVLVIGAETLSRVVDWTDRNTCVLFGDGAGAVVVSACAERCGVLASVLGSDGSGGELLIVPGGGSRLPASHESVASGSHFAKMNGREVFRFATTMMPKATQQVTAKAGWQTADLALIIPHQANARIIDSAIKRLGLPNDRFFMNIDRYGNTSAASIPIALCEAIAAGQGQDGRQAGAGRLRRRAHLGGCRRRVGDAGADAAAPLVPPFVDELPVLVGRRPFALPAHRAPHLQLGHGPGGQGRLARQAAETGGRVPLGREAEG